MNINVIMSMLTPYFALGAGLLYLIRVIQGSIVPNAISWLIWTFIGWSLAIVTWTNPETDTSVKQLAIALGVSPTTILIAALCKGHMQSVGKWDRRALIIAIGAMAIWFTMRQNPGLFPIVLLILADMCGQIPTFIFVSKAPSEDRPVAWITFSFGSLLTLLSIEKWNPESYLLPIWMVVGSLAVAYPLVAYRVRNKIHWREWIGVAASQK